MQQTKLPRNGPDISNLHKHVIVACCSYPALITPNVPRNLPTLSYSFERQDLQRRLRIESGAPDLVRGLMLRGAESQGNAQAEVQPTKRLQRIDESLAGEIGARASQ